MMALSLVNSQSSLHSVTESLTVAINSVVADLISCSPGTLNMVEVGGEVEEVEDVLGGEMVDVLDVVKEVEYVEDVDVGLVVGVVREEVEELMDVEEVEEVVGLAVVVVVVVVVISGWDLSRPPMRSLTDWMTLSTLASWTLSTGYLGVLAGPGEERRQLVLF